jgi:hypothetical protein
MEAMTIILTVKKDLVKIQLFGTIIMVIETRRCIQLATLFGRILRLNLIFGKRMENCFPLGRITAMKASLTTFVFSAGGARPFEFSTLL